MWRLPAAVQKLEKDYNFKTLLDYGTGTGNLVRKLRETVSKNMKVDGYDPAVEEWSLRPETKYDRITCLDVLEHVEPSSIDAVLNDINQLSQKFCFLNIDLQPAKKSLSDGRNAHVLLAPPDWWTSKIAAHFQCQMSIVLNHIDGYPQKLLIAACQDANYIPQMSLFIFKLRIDGIRLTGGLMKYKEL